MAKEVKGIQYKDYEIYPGANPIDVQVVVGGVPQEVVRQGYNPTFSIVRHLGDHSLDRVYSVNDHSPTAEEAIEKAIRYAKDVIDGKVPDIQPPA